MLASERLGMSLAGTLLAEPATGCSPELEADWNVLVEIRGDWRIAGSIFWGSLFVAGSFVAGLGFLGLAARGRRSAAAFLFRPTSPSAKRTYFFRSTFIMKNLPMAGQSRSNV